MSERVLLSTNWQFNPTNAWEIQLSTKLSILTVYLEDRGLGLIHFRKIYFIILFVSSKRNNYETSVKHLALYTATGSGFHYDAADTWKPHGQPNSK
jgi:hypothetical protein